MRTASAVITSVKAGEVAPVLPHRASSCGASWNRNCTHPVGHVWNSRQSTWFTEHDDSQSALSQRHSWKLAACRSLCCTTGKGHRFYTNSSVSLLARGNLHRGQCLKPPRCTENVRKRLTIPSQTLSGNRWGRLTIPLTCVNTTLLCRGKRPLQAGIVGKRLALGALTQAVQLRGTLTGPGKWTAERSWGGWSSPNSLSECQICWPAIPLLVRTLCKTGWMSGCNRVWRFGSDRLEMSTLSVTQTCGSVFHQQTRDGVTKGLWTRVTTCELLGAGNKCECSSVCALSMQRGSWRMRCLSRCQSQSELMSSFGFRSLRQCYRLLLTIEAAHGAVLGSLRASSQHFVCRYSHLRHASRRPHSILTRCLQHEVLMVHSGCRASRLCCLTPARRSLGRADPQCYWVLQPVCGQSINGQVKAVGWTSLRQQQRPGALNDGSCYHCGSEALHSSSPKEAITSEGNSGKVGKRWAWLTCLQDFVGGLRAKLLLAFIRKGRCHTKDADLYSKSLPKCYCAERALNNANHSSPFPAERVPDNVNQASSSRLRESSMSELATGSAIDVDRALQCHLVRDSGINGWHAFVRLVSAVVLLMAGYACEICILPPRIALHRKALVANACSVAKNVHGSVAKGCSSHDNCSDIGEKRSSIVIENQFDAGKEGQGQLACCPPPLDAVGSPGSMTVPYHPVCNAPDFEHHLHVLPFASIKLGGRHMIRKTAKVIDTGDRKASEDKRNEGQERQDKGKAQSPSRPEVVSQVVPTLLRKYPSNHASASLGTPPLLPQSAGECLNPGANRPTPPSYRVWQDGGAHICSDMYLDEETEAKVGIPEEKTVESEKTGLEAGGEARVGRGVERIGTARIIRDRQQRRGQQKRKRKPMTISAVGDRRQKKDAKKGNANMPISKIYVGLGEEVEVIRLGEWEWSNAELAPVDLSVAGAEEYNSVVEVPNPRRWGYWVSDQARVLSNDEVDALNHAITEMYNSTGVDMAVVTVKRVGTTVGSADSLARRLYHYWGLGIEREGCGVLLLMVMDTGRVEVEVGERLGDKLDFVRQSGGELRGQAGRCGADRGGSCWVKWLKRKRIRPKLRLGRYGAAIVAGVNEVVECVTELYGDVPRPSTRAPARRRLQLVDATWMGLICLLVAGGVLINCMEALKKLRGLSGRKVSSDGKVSPGVKASGRGLAGTIVKKWIRRVDKRGGAPIGEVQVAFKGIPRVMISSLMRLGFLHGERSRRLVAAERRAEMTDLGVRSYVQGEIHRAGRMSRDFEPKDSQAGLSDSSVMMFQTQSQESALLRPSRWMLLDGLLKGKRVDEVAEIRESGRSPLNREDADDATRVGDIDDGERGMSAWGSAVHPITMDG